MTDAKPQPCPWAASELCGTAPVAVTRDENDGWSVQCYGCGARGPDMRTRQGAIAAWSRLRLDPQWQFGDPPKPGRYLCTVDVLSAPPTRDRVVMELFWYPAEGWKVPGVRFVVRDVLAWQPMLEPWEPER